MKEKLATFINSVKDQWNKISKKQKRWLFVAFGALVIVLIVAIGLTSYKHYVPLYSQLSPAETGQIKANLDSKGIPYKINGAGTTISVPEKDVDNLKVELAAAGLPKSGQIDYSFFGQNTQFGMTDKQFDVLERAAMQTELSNLISGISGVESSQVMLNLPAQTVWVSDKPSEASASIVLRLQPGYELKPDQVQGLYHLVSKSVPNLPEDNIVIMDQYFNYYDQSHSSNSDSTLSAYQQQQQVKEDIDKNIQHRVQKMLGMMMGNDKVMVNVTTDVDFTKEKSTEKLVKPVDPTTMKGLQVSTEHIADTYKGTGGSGGTPGTGSSPIPGYKSSASGPGTTTHVEDRVNNVFNHITNDIEKSPYTITDLGIQVMVEPPKPNNPSSLPQQSVNDINKILNTIVSTTLGKGNASLTPQQIDAKTVVTVDKFNGKLPVAPVKSKHTPVWIYVVGALLALFIIILIWLLLRRRNKEEDVAAIEEPARATARNHEADLLAESKEESAESAKKKQLESMAKANPAEFVKLLRTWLSDD